MYDLEILVQGYPGKTTFHGGMGWSTVALLRGHGQNILIDTGHYMHRDVLPARLQRLGLRREDITAVALTHAHWDHCMNFPFFPKAQVFISKREIEWAAAEPVGVHPIAEFHVEKLAAAKNVTLLGDGDEFLPDLRALATPGHTPGHMGFHARGAKADYIFTGDAVKNSAELVSMQVDMTLDAPASLASVKRVRDLAAEDPNNIVVFGHDRICSFDGARVHEREPLQAMLRVRLTSDFEDITLIDLTGASV